MTQIQMSDLKTQKAKGIIALCDHYYASNLMYHTLNVLAPTRKDVCVLPYEEPVIPCFARPCPTRPRHGFVDSQPVGSVRQLCALVHAAALADKDCEIVCMKRLTGRVSAVATSAGIAFGRGNAGATDGSSSVFVPCATKGSDWKREIRAPFLGIKDCPYIELVEHDGHFVYVQQRDGPWPPAASRNFIPTNMKVEAVLTPENTASTISTDALLAWEAAINEASKKPGVVVWLPQMPLSSHYAIHAIVNELPVLTGRKCPEIGAELKVDEAKPKKLQKKDLKKIAKAMAYWLETPVKNSADVASTAVSVLHCQTQWGAEPHLLRLRGFALAMLSRFVVAACLGESRHFYRRGPGRSISRSQAAAATAAKRLEGAENRLASRFNTVPWRTILGVMHAYTIISDTTRNAVFGRAFRVPPQFLADAAHFAMLDLQEPGWGLDKLPSETAAPKEEEEAETEEEEEVEDEEEEKSETGSADYGGSNWADAAEKVEKLVRLQYGFIKDPSPKRWAEMVMLANVVLNSVHNGGYVLSKWVSQTTLNVLASKPLPGLLNVVAADLVLDRGHWVANGEKAAERLLYALDHGPKLEPDGPRFAQTNTKEGSK